MKFPATFIALCLCASVVAQPCLDNNLCTDAEDLGILVTIPIDSDCGTSGEPFTCFEGCNLSADPYEAGAPAPCLTASTPVVWYRFQTDNNASLANISVSSGDFSTPAFQLFLADQGDCSNLIPIGSCSVSAGGEVTATGIEVGGSQTYYLAVGAANDVGGDFEVCISIVEAIFNCVTNSEIEVIARSEEGPLEGPFFPGETVSICMNITGYTAIGNNCQWLQGVIPTFGNGWDPSSFNEDWMPNMNTTVNGQNAVDGSGNPIPVSGVYTGQWNWFSDVTYHHDNCLYNVGDFDGNGSLDICHELFDQGCAGPGLTGGCCAPCWQDQPGSLLPPGWYAYGTTGNCGTDGHPTVDWGDGSGCGNMSGPWTFCFDLKVREYPDCTQDPTTMDLSIGMVTTADGETGAWTGGPSVCANDAPLLLDLPVCCSELDALPNDFIELCSGDALNYTLEYPGVDYWGVEVEVDGVNGASSAGIENGGMIPDVLTTSGNQPGSVLYYLIGYQGGCPNTLFEISVEVYPELSADFETDVYTVCAAPSPPFVIEPIIAGGDPSSYVYTWSDGSNSPVLNLTGPVNGGIYTVTVSDAVGCSASASVEVDVYDAFTIEVNAPYTQVCGLDETIEVTASAEGGQGAYTFLWTSPDGNEYQGETVIAEISGIWTVIATDEQGCFGENTLEISIDQEPSIEAFDVAVCDINPTPTEVPLAISGGEAPYEVEWEGAGTTGDSEPIIVTQAGLYTVSVTDANGCSGTTEFEVEGIPETTAEFFVSINGLQVVFTNISMNVETLEWDFGDGSTSSETDPIHTYEESGIYEVVLNVTGECGDAQFSQVVSIGGPPSADFTIMDSEGCAPHAVEFIPVTAGASSYLWTFEGGSPSTSMEMNPTVTYDTQGEYDVELIVVSSAGGDTVYREDAIVVFQSTEAKFEYVLDGPVVTVDNMSTGAVEYQWQIGDSLIVQNEFEFEFEDNGEYQVQLIASGPCGSDTASSTVVIDVLPVADFSVQDESGCAPREVLFQSSAVNATNIFWHFPGGIPSESSENSVLVTYPDGGLYDVTHVATNQYGTDSLLFLDVVDVLPLPAGGFSTLTEGTVVMFQNTSQDAESFYWDFGNGDTSTLRDPIIDFGDLGVYDVQLIVSNACGSDTVVQTISLFVLPLPQFVANMQSGCAPLEVQFTDMSQNGPAEWLWRFPGGIPAMSNESDPVVRYDSAGVYDVELTVSNANGTQTLISQDYIVVDGAPEADFGASIFGNTAIFSNQSANGGTLLWDFGDGVTSDLVNPLHQYDGPGTYTVILVVTNPCGVDPVAKDIFITGPVISGFPVEKVKVFPNPNNGNFVIEVDELWEDNATYEIIGMDGRLMSHGRLTDRSSEINLGDQAASGVYQLIVKNGLETYLERMVITPD